MTSRPMHPPPRISVIIPTYNRRCRLERVLTALRRQTMPAHDIEIVVVSDGSTDGTDAYLTGGAGDLNVIAARQDNLGPAAARNHGLALATAELVLFMDDDVVPLPWLVEQHLEAHERHGPKTVVLGPMLNPPDHQMSPWVRYEQAMLAKQYEAMERGDWQPTARQFYTGNASLPRQEVIDAGGFDVAFRRAEDVELAYRLADRGLRFIFQPEAAGLHYAERKYASWRGNADAYGRNDVTFGRELGRSWLLTTVRREFHNHHPLLQAVVRCCLDRPALTAVTVKGCEFLCRIAATVGAEPVSRASLSFIYNMTYYQAVANELGSASMLLDAAFVDIKG